jgi:muramoyltetrapeptide carboxypeptidase
MKVPPALKPGDHVAIVSTARKISPQEIQASAEALSGWGLQVITGDSIGAKYFQFAGDDELRRKDFQRMLDDEKVKAILFARGGYGTVRLIDEIDWRRFLKNPKWLCGYSDVTVIHSHLQAVYQVPTIHSLMSISFPSATHDSLESLRRVLFGEPVSFEFAGQELNCPGEARGVVCGGNLSLLNGLLRSASEVDTAGKILFIEEVDEHLYHVDRMMMALKRAGQLENLAALLVGHLTDLKNKDEMNPFGQSGAEIIASHVREYDYPVAFGFPAGHESQNLAFKMGLMAEVNLKEVSRFSQRG